MTVQTKKVTAGPYVGDGISTVFAFDFGAQSKEHFIVRAGEKGKLKTLSLNADYEVKLMGDRGSIVLNSPLPASHILTIRRNTDKSQLVDYIQGDSFPASVHEGALDKLTHIIQEISSDVEHSIKVEDINNVGDTLLGFDTDGFTQNIKISDGLVKEADLLKVKPNVGILSNEYGVSVLYGRGIGTYNNAIVVKIGDGLEFDDQFRVRVELELINVINEMKDDLIDLTGYVKSIAYRVSKLEEGIVDIKIGNGLNYNLDGELQVKAHTGILVTPSGVSVRIGDGLEVDTNGDIRVSDALQTIISKKAEKTELPKAEDLAGEGLEAINGKIAVVKPAEDERLKIIYPNNGTEAAPANIKTNTRYVMDNPFPGKRVSCWVELYYLNEWGKHNEITTLVTSGGAGLYGGCIANTLGLNTVVVQVAVSYLIVGAGVDGNVWGAINGTSVSTAPARVVVELIE